MDDDWFLIVKHTEEDEWFYMGRCKTAEECLQVALSLPLQVRRSIGKWVITQGRKDMVWLRSSNM